LLCQNRWQSSLIGVYRNIKPWQDGISHPVDILCSDDGLIKEIAGSHIDALPPNAILAAVAFSARPTATITTADLPRTVRTAVLNTVSIETIGQLLGTIPAATTATVISTFHAHAGPDAIALTELITDFQRARTVSTAAATTVVPAVPIRTVWTTWRRALEVST